MRGAATVILAGTGLAALTAGLGLYGVRDWDGESGGHWVALAGLTFLIPLLATGSWVFAALFHWAICMGIAGMVWWAFRLTRPARRPVPFPEPQPAEPWVPPPPEVIARVVRGRGGDSPPAAPRAEPGAAADPSGD
jgi:hypothetical protein